MTNIRTGGLKILLCISCLFGAIHISAAESDTATNEQIIREFIAAWSNLNAEELAGYFTDDGTYYNMPAKPVSGRVNVQKFIEAFLSTWTETEWVILNIAEKVTPVLTPESLIDSKPAMQLINDHLKISS